MMQFQMKEIYHLAISLILTAVLITICILFTGQARMIEAQHRNALSFAADLQNERYWRSYEGTKTGADVVDFIVRHKDVCDIVIRDDALSVVAAVRLYLSGNTLVMGLADTRDIPDFFWDMTFLYQTVLGGDGTRMYTAVLLYNGQLSPEYEAGVQVREGPVTGVAFTRT